MTPQIQPNLQILSGMGNYKLKAISPINFSWSHLKKIFSLQPGFATLLVSKKCISLFSKQHQNFRFSQLWSSKANQKSFSWFYDVCFKNRFYLKLIVHGCEVKMNMDIENSNVTQKFHADIKYKGIKPLDKVSTPLLVYSSMDTC